MSSFTDLSGFKGMVYDHILTVTAVLNIQRTLSYSSLIMFFRQAEEMAEALSGGVGGRAFSDTQINGLAQRHFERLEVVEVL